MIDLEADARVVLATLMLTAVAGTAAATRESPAVDLAWIGHVSSKGRVQDKQYNPEMPLIDELIEAGPAAIPFLVLRLEDETEIRQSVFDFWPAVRVGDVALVILCDFFTRPDWQDATIPGLKWDTLLERDSPDRSGWEVLDRFLKRHGRSGLREKVEVVLQPYDGRLEWDATERCFKPRK